MADIISFVIEGTATGLLGAVGQAEAGLDRLQASGNRVASGLQSAMGTVAVAGVAGLAAGFVGAVGAAGTFEKQMSAVGAVAGATEAEMASLTKSALQLGKDTSFSAQEAAVGLEELIKAGVSVGDVLGGAGRAALDLAAAGAVSVGEAAEIASNAMNVFGKSGADMAHVADIIAGAANASAISVHDYQMSLAASGAVAATVGIDFESLSTAIAVMGQAGIKGSDAGTSLKTMLLNLQPTTKQQIATFKELGIVTDDGGNKFFDASGKAKSMADIAQVLQDALGGMTKQQQLATLEIMFGSDAIRAGAVLLKAGSAGFNDMATAMGKVTAQKVAEDRLNNLFGSVEKLKGSLETGAIILGGMFTPALKSLADTLTNQVNTGIEVLERLPDVFADVASILSGNGTAGNFEGFLADMGFSEATIVMIDDIVAQIGEAGLAIGVIFTDTIVPAITAIAEPLAIGTSAFLGVIAVSGVLTTAIGVVGAALSLFLTPLGAVALGVGVMAAAWKDNWGGVQEKTAQVWGVVQPVLTQLFDWLSVKIPQALTWVANVGFPTLVTAMLDVSTWITGTGIPAAIGLYDWLYAKLSPALTWLATTGWPMLLTAGAAVTTWVTGTAVPAIEKLYNFLYDNLPPAIMGVISVFEQLRGRVGPIIKEVFEGDIRGTLSLLGTAFADLGNLMLGWLSAQVAKIPWDRVWSTAVSAGTSLITFLGTQALNLAGWLGAQVAKIPWPTVWAQAVAIGTTLLTFLSTQAVNFAGWLGAQVAAIPWATIWTQAKDVARTLADYLITQAIDFGTWLGEQVALIPWETVWAQTVEVAEKLATRVSELTVDFVTWLSAQAAAIPWDDVWSAIQLTGEQVANGIIAAASDLDARLTTWLNQKIAEIKWAELGDAFGRSLVGSVQTGVDGAVSGGTAFDTAALQAGILAFLDAAFKGAWEQTLANWRTLTPGESYAAVFVEGLDRGGMVEALMAIDQRLLAEWNAHRQADWENFVAWDLKKKQEWDAFAELMWQGLQAWGVKALAEAELQGQQQFDSMVAWGAKKLEEFTTWSGLMFDGLVAWGARMLTAITEWLTNTGTTISEGWNGIHARATEAMDAIWGVVTQKGTDIAGAFTNMVAEWIAAGKAMGEGLVKSVVDALAGMVEAVTKPIQDALDAARRLLPGGGGGAAPSGGGGGDGGAATSSGAVNRSSSKQDLIARAKEWAIAQGLEDPELFAAQVMQESSFDIDADSGVARGLGQFTRETGQRIADKLGVTYEELVSNPELSLQGSAMHMRELQDQFGSQERALSAYFAGPNGGVRPDYVSAVRGRLGQVAGVQPRPQNPVYGPAVPPGVSTGMVTVRNKRTGLESQMPAEFLDPNNPNHPTNMGDFEVVSGGAPPGGSMGLPEPAMGPGQYVSPIAGMGPVGAHWGVPGAVGGTDIFAPGGTPIQSIGAGTVVSANYEPMGGWNVMVQGADGKRYYYAHMQDAPDVKAGQTVAAGDILGRVGDTGNAAGKGTHLHLGIGDAIQSGMGVQSGLGTNFNAIQFLNDIRDGKYRPGLLQLNEDTGAVGATFAKTNEAISPTGPELSAIGEAIDPVVAAMDEGSASTAQMTDAIIASAASNGVATESATAYSEGLIGQDTALRNVVAAFAETTPAAADLLAQMDAGTISTGDAAIAFAGLSTSTAVATGALQTMATDGGAAVTDLATNGVAQFGTLQTGALTAADLMNAGVVTAASLMSAGVLAATDVMEDGTLTSAGLMQAGTITAAELMNAGVVTEAQVMEAESVLSAQTMQKDVVTAATDMNTDTVTEAQGMNSDVVTEAQGMQSDVVTAAEDMQSDTVTAAEGMNSDVVTEAGTMASDATTAAEGMQTDVSAAAQGMQSDVTTAAQGMAGDVVGEIDGMATGITGALEPIPEAADDAVTSMEAIGDVDIPAPDVDGVIDALGDVEDAAKDAAKAVSSVGGKGGHKGGDDEDDPFGKRATGGPVQMGVPVIVGDGGRPELFVPGSDGWIFPTVPTAANVAGQFQNPYSPVGTSQDMISGDWGKYIVEDISNLLMESNDRLTVSLSDLRDAVVIVQGIGSETNGSIQAVGSLVLSNLNALTAVAVRMANDVAKILPLLTTGNSILHQIESGIGRLGTGGGGTRPPSTPTPRPPTAPRPPSGPPPLFDENSPEYRDIQARLTAGKITAEEAAAEWERLLHPEPKRPMPGLGGPTVIEPKLPGMGLPVVGPIEPPPPRLPPGPMDGMLPVKPVPGPADLTKPGPGPSDQTKLATASFKSVSASASDMAQSVVQSTTAIRNTATVNFSQMGSNIVDSTTGMGQEVGTVFTGMMDTSFSDFIDAAHSVDNAIGIMSQSVDGTVRILGRDVVDHIGRMRLDSVGEADDMKDLVSGAAGLMNLNVVGEADDMRLKAIEKAMDMRHGVSHEVDLASDDVITPAAGITAEILFALGTALYDGSKTKAAQIGPAIKEGIAGARVEPGGFLVKAFEAGQDVAEEFADGISDKRGKIIKELVDAAKEAIDDAVDKAKSRIPSSLGRSSSRSDVFMTSGSSSEPGMEELIAEVKALRETIAQARSIDVTYTQAVAPGLAHDVAILEAQARGGT